ncbi:hypothetical protein BZG02_02740 [Labilibaculum filiforme]|uniref:Sulfatase N-terminal domain-containing protein n=2 Tax=Labilibaculum filiforme TaxID=1940526 RepID=A0A2N3I3B4_9BACT|nr:hypothetical protein BZG02_02740 [Labilibaculum filiforme]
MLLKSKENSSSTLYMNCNMNRIVRAVFLILLLALIPSTMLKAESDRPNILILFLDDLDPDFGCYGNKLTQTPNIDQLAGEGMRFTRAYATAPVCSPSHTSLFTGCYASTVGCPQHRSSYIDKLPEAYTILTQLMSEAGYFTVNFKSNGDRMYNKIYGATAKTDLNFDRGKWENNQESGKEVFDHLQIIDPTDISTYFNGGEWTKKREGQPFFAYANIETGKKHGFEPGRIWAKERGIAVDSTHIDVPLYYSDNGEVRHILASSLDAVSHVDFEVGKFLDALEESGCADNTMVILMSDHGATLQRHKQCLWYTGVHIPMILRWPNHIKAGQVNKELASIIDIAPTCLQAVSAEVPKTMEGLNLLSKAPRKRTCVFATRDGMDGTFDCSRTVITKDFQYIHHFFPELPYCENSYASRALTFKSMKDLQKNNKLTDLQAMYFIAKPPFELYDLQKDIKQLKNLAFDVKHQEQVKNYQQLLFKWQKQTGDKIIDARKYLGVDKVPINTSVDGLLEMRSKELE